MKLETLMKANQNLQKLFPQKYQPITLEDIEAVYGRNVLSINADSKTRKGVKKGYMTGILYLSPTDLSGINVCAMASKGCKEACLFTAGRGRFYMVTRQRIIKTLAYHFDKPRFIEIIKKSIKSLIVKANNKGMKPCVRLNGTSDLIWDKNTDIIQSFPKVKFYDYSKIAKRFLFDIPKNYHLTFSLSEVNESDTRAVLSKGHNVAMVFRNELPKTYWGYPVINGDLNDLRFTDAKGVIVALKAKAKAKKDTTGFVKDYTGIVNYANGA